MNHSALYQEESKRFRFCKAPAKHDDRNLMFAAIPKLPVSVPPEDDFVKHQGVQTPMFANDQLGDCVIAGRVHRTLRFELVEHNVIIPITDKAVERSYFEETGGPDSGPDLLDSLKLWCKQGWRAAKKRYNQILSQIKPNQPQ